MCARTHRFLRISQRTTVAVCLHSGPRSQRTTSHLSPGTSLQRLSRIGASQVPQLADSHRISPTHALELSAARRGLRQEEELPQVGRFESTFLRVNEIPNKSARSEARWRSTQQSWVAPNPQKRPHFLSIDSARIRTRDLRLTGDYRKKGGRYPISIKNTCSFVYFCVSFCILVYTLDFVLQRHFARHSPRSILSSCV